MSFQCDDADKSKLLGALYQGGAVKFTRGRVHDERDAVVASTMIDLYKGVSLGVLYHACATHFTGDEMIAERTKILDPNSPGRWKLMALKHLYRTCVAQITPDILINELVNIRDVRMRAYGDVNNIVHFLYDTANLFTPDMILASLQPDGRECFAQDRQNDDRNSQIHEWLAIKRAWILTRAMSDWDKATVLGVFYRGCAAYLTPEGVSSERAEVMASGISEKSAVLGALYQSGLAKMDVLHRIHELNAILDAMIPSLWHVLVMLGFEFQGRGVSQIGPNGTVFVGHYYGDRGYGDRGLVGPVKETRPDGTVWDGIYCDDGYGCWRYTLSPK